MTDFAAAQYLTLELQRIYQVIGFFLLMYVKAFDGLEMQDIEHSTYIDAITCGNVMTGHVRTARR